MDTKKQLLEFGGILAFMGAIIFSVIEFINIGEVNSLEGLISIADGLGWFFGAFLAATIFTAYLVVIARTKFLIRFIAIPFWLFFTISLIFTVDQFLGYPYPAEPSPGEVIAYRVKIENNGDKVIEAWFFVHETQRARLFSFPHELNKEKALRQALLSAKNGQPMRINLNPDNPKSNGIKPSPTDMLDFFESEETLKPYEKDLPPQQPQQQQQQQNNDETIILKVPGKPDIILKPGQPFSVDQEGNIELNNKFTTPPLPKHQRERGNGYVPVEPLNFPDSTGPNPADQRNLVPENLPIEEVDPGYTDLESETFD